MASFANILISLPISLFFLSSLSLSLSSLYLIRSHANMCPYAYGKLEGSEVPALATKLSLWFPDSYLLCYVGNPTSALMKQMHVERLPSMMIMVPTVSEEGQVNFRGVPYDRSKFGGIKFANLLRYLATVEMELKQNHGLNRVPAKGKNTVK